MIGSAGDVLLDGTIRAHELLAERTERANDLIATRVTQMKTVIESSEGALDRAAGQASEHLAGRVAQLQAIMETAEGKLTAASASLEKQTGDFRVFGRNRLAGTLTTSPSNSTSTPSRSNRWPMPPWRAPNSCLAATNVTARR